MIASVVKDEDLLIGESVVNLADNCRLGAMCQWLQSVAQQSLTSSQPGASYQSEPAPELIHCIATILWRTKQLYAGQQLLDIVPVELLR